MFDLFYRYLPKFVKPFLRTYLEIIPLERRVMVSDEVMADAFKHYFFLQKIGVK